MDDEVRSNRAMTMPASNLWHLLVAAREAHGARIAVRDGELTWTYEDLARRATGLARRLQREGILAGDRVAVLDGNTAGFLAAYFATAAIDAVLVPLNTRLAAAELVGILLDAEPRLLLVGADHRATATSLVAAAPSLRGVLPLADLAASDEALAPRCGADDLAQLYYTSGTTGRPKGVMLTHRNVATHAAWAVAELALGTGDVWGHFAPMFHLADAWAVFAITLAGGRHVMLPRFEAARAVERMVEEGVTISNLVPTMLTAMMGVPAPVGFPHLRLVLSGGAPIAVEVIRRVRAYFGCEYGQTYGMTETSPFLTLSRIDASLRDLPADEQLRQLAKTGRPFAEIELRVVDDAGAPVVADERSVGEIRVRGPTVTPGYWRNPDATAAAFADGWLCTGDLAVVDARGFVTIVDRKKDMIVSGGENVYSIEVEKVLHAHPAVLEAAVIGVPDVQWGEAVHAAVVLAPGAAVAADDLRAFCRQRLAGFKTPKAIRLCDALPRTGSGKIDKKSLRPPPA